MRLIIAGSRDFNNKEKVMEIIEYTITQQGLKPLVVLCGCAKGVDTIGAEWAFSKGIEIEYFPAKWKEKGKVAGILRNREMANAADTLLVIRKQDSKGSSNMKEEALKRGLEVHDFIIPDCHCYIYENTPTHTNVEGL